MRRGNKFVLKDRFVMQRQNTRTQLQFKGGNMRDAWRGLNSLAGQTQPQAMDSVSSLSEQTDRAETFYDFYCRFDRFDFTAELSQVLDRVRQNICTYVNDTEVEEITPAE